MSTFGTFLTISLGICLGLVGIEPIPAFIAVVVFALWVWWMENKDESDTH